MEGQLLAPAVWDNTSFINHFFNGLKTRTKAFTPPTGESFGLDFIVRAIKLCSICLDIFRKGSDGLVGGALDGHPLNVQQLDICIRCLSGSRFLN